MNVVLKQATIGYTLEGQCANGFSRTVDPQILWNHVDSFRLLSQTHGGSICPATFRTRIRGAERPRQ